MIIKYILGTNPVTKEDVMWKSWRLAAAVPALVVILVGLAFGETPTVTTFTDPRDGKVYKTVKIGSQVWMAENLNYAAKGSVCYGERFGVLIGDGIPSFKKLSPVEVQANCEMYGRLYDFDAAKNACPYGTHLPTDAEWTTLTDYAGGEETAGTKLKSSTGWDIVKDVPKGTDDYGFSALPCGYDGGSATYGVTWWSATENNDGSVWNRSIEYHTGRVKGGKYHKSNLFSVRCVVVDKDIFK